MYDYPHYKENDKQLLLEFMQKNPFVMLIGTDENGRVEVTQIPVLIEERENKLFLKGHIAKKSSHQKAFETNPDILAIFAGPHTYISGTLYTGNLEQASTWNYISVHARGSIRWMEEEELIQLLRSFTLHFENNNTASTTIYDNLPSEYIDKLIKAIVGFEMEVIELENVHKLSQNRDEKSYDNIVKNLKEKEGDAATI
ncbi:MAG: FMN-binding negative transcriptional regulator, partial [Chitinophagaceae bacterium]|nr:FMN-binding negative transcriptional regulator [Chitinophagaceae bacterium]